LRAPWQKADWSEGVRDSSGNQQAVDLKAWWQWEIEEGLIMAMVRPSECWSCCMKLPPRDVELDFVTNDDHFGQ
jgi:hypothetical protein